MENARLLRPRGRRPIAEKAVSEADRLIADAATRAQGMECNARARADAVVGSPREKRVQPCVQSQVSIIFALRCEQPHQVVVHDRAPAEYDVADVDRRVSESFLPRSRSGMTLRRWHADRAWMIKRPPRLFA